MKGYSGRQDTRYYPTWATSVIRLFYEAIIPWGRDFDIMYAPVTNSLDYANSFRTKRWARPGAYWHSVLFFEIIVFAKCRCIFNQSSTN